MPHRLPAPSFFRRRQRGSVLIIVLVICLGLVSLTLYFANSMSSELRAADNRVAEAEARQAVEAGIRYAAYVLKTYGTNGTVPSRDDYKAEALPVGQATFWFIGRDPNVALNATEPYFGLIDESSKLNLNTSSSARLQGLPVITSDVADAVVAWRTTSSNSSTADNLYAQLDPPRHNKGSAFETVDELRLVYGMTPAILYGEDTNRNGVLDANEDDADQSAPHDNQDGQLLGGVAEYTTVYSKLPAKGASGSARIDISNDQGRLRLLQRLTNCGVDRGRATAAVSAVSGRTFDSVMAFWIASGLTADDFALVHTEFIAGTTRTGLVNVNTASETVLACIPGIGTDNASSIVAYRTAHTDALTSFAWLRTVLSQTALQSAGRYITDQSYQFSADVAAVGHHGRGYYRRRVVFDMSTGTPRIVYSQDLTAFGWALGTKALQDLQGQNQI